MPVTNNRVGESWRLSLGLFFPVVAIAIAIAIAALPADFFRAESASSLTAFL